MGYMGRVRQRKIACGRCSLDLQASVPGKKPKLFVLGLRFVLVLRASKVDKVSSLPRIRLQRDEKSFPKALIWASRR